MGAGTAQMAIGLRERPEEHGVTIDCYDNFRMSASSAAKAATQGVQIAMGQDTFEWVGASLRPFGADIHLHKGTLGSRTVWSGRPISVYVDDASKYPRTFIQCLKIFGPSWVEGQTIVLLMDYWLFKKSRGRTAEQLDDLRCQFDFVSKNPQHFEPINELSDTTCAAFRYTKQFDFGSLSVPPVRRRNILRRILRRLTAA